MGNAIQAIKAETDIVTGDTNGVEKILKKIYGGNYETFNNHAKLSIERAAKIQLGTSISSEKYGCS